MQLSPMHHATCMHTLRWHLQGWSNHHAACQVLSKHTVGIHPSANVPRPDTHLDTVTVATSRQPLLRRLLASAKGAQSSMTHKAQHRAHKDTNAQPRQHARTHTHSLGHRTFAVRESELQPTGAAIRSMVVRPQSCDAHRCAAKS